MLERFQNVEVKITDKDFLKTIPAEKVSLYLKSKGWRVQDEIKISGQVKGEIWIRDEEQDSVLLPKSETFSDYPIRLSETLEVLSQQEGKNQLTIVEEILQEELSDELSKIEIEFQNGHVPLESVRWLLKEVRYLRDELETEVSAHVDSVGLLSKAWADIEKLNKQSEDKAK